MLDDITERMKTQENLLISEERNRKIIDLNPFPIIVFSNGDVAFINQKFTNLLGYTLEDIPTGREWSRNAYPDKEYRSKVIESFKNYTINPNDPSRGIDPFTFNVTCKNGDVRRIIFKPVEFDKGKQLFMLEDITERVKAQDELVSHIKRQGLIVEKSPFPIISFYKDIVEYLNPKFTELFGYTIEDIPNGREWSRKAYPDKEYRAKVIKAFKDYESNPDDPTRGIDPFTFNVSTKDGRIRKIIFNPVALDKDRQFFICEDITDREKTS